LESKVIVDTLRPEEFDLGNEGDGGHARAPHCTSLAWSADGSTLFAGYSDKIIRVYVVTSI
jgi:guanine nucleotide-binding protein subunit beta-2-like 1 protein